MGKFFLVIVLSYLIGNFTSAYVLGRLFTSRDVREYGSGNAGATNALRVFGKKLGFISFLLDTLKGVLAAFLGHKMLGYNGMLIASIFVVIGHNWPVFLKFKGGKGIATSLGVMLYLHWPTTLVCAIIVVFIILKTRYVSLGSILGAILIPIISNIIIKPFNIKFLLATAFLGIMAVYRHKENIYRLRSGSESKLGDRIN